MSETIIDAIYKRNQEILGFLDSNKEITFRSDFGLQSTKNLVLSIASFFEALISELILRFAECASLRNEVLCSFVKRKAIVRQYHTFFAWDGNNANAFFSLFGEEFKKRCQGKVQRDSTLEESIKAFLELGNIRNELVHRNFAEYQLAKTSEEYYALYKKALLFIDFIQRELSL